MKINLAHEDVFKDNEISFDKNINFVFGKNGTGKSTITKLIKEQASGYDIRIFQGFEGILDANKKLNAVVLGEENTSINSQIEDKLDDIEKIKQQITTIMNTINMPENADDENFRSKYENAKTAFTSMESEIKQFKTLSAADIKNETSPQLSAPSYNVRNFASEIEKACFLQDTEISQLTSLLKSEAKKADKTKLPIIDLRAYLKDVNEILNNKVNEKVIITRLENNEDKRKFAEKELNCHHKGDICAFCGNKIEDDTFIELESYFSADEVKIFQNRIQFMIERINQEILNTQKVDITLDQFYPEFLEKLTFIKDEIEGKLKSYSNFFLKLMSALQSKESNLFVESSMLDLEIPLDFSDLQIKFNDIVNENNKNDLLKKQNEAQEKLRYHKIKMLINKFDYNVKINELGNLEKEMNKALLDLSNEKNKIDGENGLNNQISNIQGEINNLRAQTKDEKKLALIINAKLKHFVSCELDHYENEDGKGFYRVKCLRSNTIRDITQL
ncbi:MAG TPA: hypothetical protein DC000_05290, partial [Clostridiales bacterium]|nr:hypothetical protein [Clostridiales bacterium]